MATFLIIGFIIATFVIIGVLAGRLISKGEAVVAPSIPCRRFDGSDLDAPLVTRSSITTRSMCDSLSLDGDHFRDV